MSIRVHQRIAAVLLLLLCLTGSDRTVAAGEQDAPAGRVISFEPGAPIADRLRHDDTVVTVLRFFFRPSIRFPPNSDYTYAEWKVEHADVVVVARIVEARGVLTAEGDWVETYATAVVEEPLKATSSQALSRGLAFVFTASGGDTTINGKAIRARLEGVRPLTVGLQYLLLGGVGANGVLSVRTDNIYEIRDGVVASSDREDGDPLTWIGGAGDVFSAIRKYVAAPRRKPNGDAR
jgi:hypothetical protein